MSTARRWSSACSLKCARAQPQRQSLCWPLLPAPTSLSPSTPPCLHQLDAQLARISRADPRTCLLRDCAAVVVRLGDGRDPAAAAGRSGGGGGGGAATPRLAPSVAALVKTGAASLDRLQRLQARAVAAEVRLMGGAVASDFSAGTTHVVGIALPPPPEAAAAQGQQAAEEQLQAALLRSVSEQAGGPRTLATLRLHLATAKTRLVAPRWAAVGMQAHACCLQELTSMPHAHCLLLLAPSLPLPTLPPPLRLHRATCPQLGARVSGGGRGVVRARRVQPPQHHLRPAARSRWVHAGLAGVAPLGLAMHLHSIAS